MSLIPRYISISWPGIIYYIAAESSWLPMNPSLPPLPDLTRTPWTVASHNSITNIQGTRVELAVWSQKETAIWDHFAHLCEVLVKSSVSYVLVSSFFMIKLNKNVLLIGHINNLSEKEYSKDPFGSQKNCSSLSSVADSPSWALDLNVSLLFIELLQSHIPLSLESSMSPFLLSIFYHHSGITYITF